MLVIAGSTWDPETVQPLCAESPLAHLSRDLVWRCLRWACTPDTITQPSLSVQHQQAEDEDDDLDPPFVG